MACSVHVNMACLKFCSSLKTLASLVYIQSCYYATSVRQMSSECVVKKPLLLEALEPDFLHTKNPACTIIFEAIFLALRAAHGSVNAC